MELWQILTIIWGWGVMISIGVSQNPWLRSTKLVHILSELAHALTWFFPPFTYFLCKEFSEELKQAMSGGKAFPSDTRS